MYRSATYLVLLAAAAVLAAPRWTPLLDGTSLSRWTNSEGKAPGAGWRLDRGTLTRQAAAGDIITLAQYRDFVLEFEWKAAAGANSGVKYRIHRTDEGEWIGPEYQIIDDAVVKSAPSPGSQGALYNVVAPVADRPILPIGQWNRSKIVAQGVHLEHWLNGKKVVEINTDSADWRRRVAGSKFAKYAGYETWYGTQAGPILVQDHGGEVSIRNMRIRETASGTR